MMIGAQRERLMLLGQRMPDRVVEFADGDEV